MYKSIYLFSNKFILVFCFLVFGYLSLGLSCAIVIHVTFSVAKVSGPRRVVSVVWAINSKGGEEKSEIWFDQLNISVINSTS